MHAGFGGAKIAIPLHALQLGVAPFTVGLIMAMCALCPMLIALYVGKLVDRLGGRVPMLIGSAGVAAAVLIPFVFEGIVALCAMAILVGTAFQFFFVPTQGITGALGGPEDRARNYSLLALGFSIASFIGPLVAGYSIEYLGYRTAYLVLAVGPVCAALLLWRKGGLLPKAGGGRRAARKEKGSSFGLLRDTKMRDAIVASSLISVGWDLYQFYFPIYGHSIGLSPSTIGTIISTFALAVFSIRLALPHLARKYTEFELLLYGIGFAGAALLLFPLFREPVPARAGFLRARAGMRRRPADVDVAHLRAVAARARFGRRGAAGHVQPRHAPHRADRLRRHRHGAGLRAGLHFRFRRAPGRELVRAVDGKKRGEGGEAARSRS